MFEHWVSVAPLCVSISRRNKVFALDVTLITSVPDRSHRRQRNVLDRTLVAAETVLAAWVGRVVT
ncbi:hypothetical protein ACFPQ7_19510 [Methylobacterium iners]